MTVQFGKSRRGGRRAVVSGVTGVAIAAGLLAGFGSPAALAEPADPTTQTDAPPTPTMTADQALAIIKSDYDTGAGGGQLSNLIHDVLTLRAQGYQPSNTNKVAIEAALDKRPNQAPLIEALQATLAYQRKLQAIQQRAGSAQQQGGYGVGIGQPPPGMGPVLPPGVPADPGNNPGIGIFLPTG
jgi:hypothetical protein